MSFHFFLNDKFYDCFFHKKPYENVFKLDISCLNIECKIHNKFQMIAFNPRSNIHKISMDVEFFFNEEPRSNQYGMINTSSHIYYSRENTEKIKCTLFFKGFYLTSIYIYMPTYNRLFIKELKFRHYPRFVENCCICLENNNKIINVHQNQYNHNVCFDCLLKIDKCPICRLII